MKKLDNQNTAMCGERANACVKSRPVSEERLKLSGKYSVECRGPDGELKWAEDITNLVVTVGLNKMLDEALAGSTYTAAWYVGLISSTGYTTGPAAGDTMASHGGWQEDTTYSEGARPTATWSAASGGSKAFSAAKDFSINGTTTIKGCFLCSDATKSGTSGVLYSAGLFTGGDKAVGDGDTLSVSYTATLTAS